MGCSTSRSTDENGEDGHRASKDEFVFMTSALEKLLMSKNPEDQLKAFVQLDKAIMMEEGRNPSSLFGLAMSRQQLIKNHLRSAAEMNKNEILSGESPTFDLFSDLGLAKNPEEAAEHEEFLASINRRALNERAIKLLEQMLDSVDEQIKSSTQRISQLQSAYHQQDELLGQIFGEMYGSEREKVFEKELDTMRYFRDMLSIGVLQWELCLSSAQSAANLLRGGVSSWRALKNQALEQKVASGTDARNAFQEALLLIQTSQEVLQDVQFPYCTTRELKGVSQTIEYVFTDILIEDRYSRASEVYENFLQKAVSLKEWVEEVLRSQLQKDLMEIEEKVAEAALKLRNERIYLICTNLGVEPPPEELPNVSSSYAPRRKPPPAEQAVIPFQRLPDSKLELTEGEHSLQEYFRKIVENRKNTMWPSRRIDELQALMVQE